MKSKSLQHFSEERLARDASLSKDEIARFLSDFQAVVHGDEGPRKLISLRVPEGLMRVFKEKAKRAGTRYQTQIVELMRQWIGSDEEPAARSPKR